MSLAAQELQVQSKVPIWPNYKLEEKDVEVTFSAYVRKEVEGVMYKTLTRLRFSINREEDKKVVIENLIPRFHDYCYKILILGKPNVEQIDRDTRTEILRLAQELV